MRTSPLQTETYTLPRFIESIAFDLSGNRERTRAKRLYRNDRVAFAYDVFPDIRLATYQENILGAFDDGKNRVAVRSPHGAGKTAIAALLVHHSVLTAESDCKVPTTASAWRQLEKYLWPEIKKVERLIAWPILSRPAYCQRTELLSLSIRLDSGLVEAFALASDNFALIEGAHASRLAYIFDEAKTIPVGMWDAAEGAFSSEGLGDSEILALAISTPGDPSGRFHDIHTGAPGLEDWHCIHITLEEAIANHRISRAWAEARARQWGVESAVYQNRVLGEFADNTEDGIIPASWVRAANDRWKEWDSKGRPTISGRRIIGIDSARKGADSTVLAVRSGSVIKNLHTIQKGPITQTASLTIPYATGYTLNIEMDGIGSSLYDILKEDKGQYGKNFQLKPVVAAGKTYKSDRSGELFFVNVRAAMWWNLREMLDPVNGDGIMLPPHEFLLKDLITPRWEMKRGGRIQLESVRSIKSRLGRSPDYGTAVCLAFWDVSRGGGAVF